MIIPDPIDDDYVWKIAYNDSGIESNTDEYNTFTNCPKDLKKYLGECKAIYADANSPLLSGKPSSIKQYTNRVVMREQTNN